MIVVRDLLKYAEDGVTARRLIKAGKFLVDGKVVKDPRYPLGLMDVFSAPELEEYYRVLIKPRKGPSLFKITGEEAGFKICQILRKHHVKGGGLALGLHDGRTIMFKGEDVETGRRLKVFDGVKISLPNQKLLETVTLEKGVYGYIHSGSRAGLHGTVTKIKREVVFPDKPSVSLETAQGNVTTLLKNIMPIGVGKPWITLQ